MTKKFISILFTIIFFMGSLKAQSAQPDFITSIGKIYVVVAVVAIIFLGIIFYLVYLDRKISRLEKSIENEFKTS